MSQTQIQTNKSQIKINIHSDNPPKLIYEIIDYIRQNMSEMIKQIPLYQLKEYKKIIAKVLAANEIDVLDISVKYEAVFDDILGTYTVNDIKRIDIDPYCCGVKFIITLINDIEIKIEIEPQNTMFMTRDVVLKLNTLTTKYIEEIEKLIKEKEDEEEEKWRISELLDKLWNHYDLKQTIQEIVEKYNIEVDDVEKLVNSIKNTLERLKKIINDEDHRIEELEDEIRTFREFIKDNDLVEKFTEWYKQKKKEEIDSELEEEAREILGIGEEEDEDC